MANRTKDALGIVAENVVRHEEYWELIRSAAEAIYMQLRMHCGPCAYTAMIAFPGDSSANGKFTADGITIVRTMTFSAEANPVFEIVRQMAVSVGTSVDGAARDGTTTAMMIFARLLIIIAESKTHRFELRDKLVRDIAAAKEYMRNEIRSARRQDIERAVTLSSRGDKQVIDAVMTVIDRMPKAFLETYTTYMAGVDKKDGVRVSVEDTKYPAKAYVTAYGNPEIYLNDTFGARFEDTSAGVIFYNPVLFGHMPSAMLTYVCDIVKNIFDAMFFDSEGNPLPTFNQEAVEDFHRTTHSLVIVAPYVSDITSYGFQSAKPFRYLGNENSYWTMLDAINAINGALQSCELSSRIMLVSPVGDSRNNADYLLKWLPTSVAATAQELDVSDLGVVGYIVRNARAHYDGKYLRLGNLFGDAQINPQFTESFMTESEDDSKYTQIIREMMHVVRLDTVKMEDDQRRAQAIADEITPMLMSMVMSSVPRIVITGNIHSELHDQDVVADAIGSSIALINRGVINAPWHKIANGDPKSELSSAVRYTVEDTASRSQFHPDYISIDVDALDEDDIIMPIPASGVMETLHKVEEFITQLANSNAIIMDNARINVN